VIDQIHIEQLELRARVGVPDAERAEPQRLVLNITLWPDLAEVELHDDVLKTVNYSSVAEMARQTAGQRSFRLIETLAEEIASELLAQFHLHKVAVEVRKFVLPDAEFVAVTAVCERKETRRKLSSRRAAE
jgi:dihydroneopterin aldolase